MEDQITPLGGQEENDSPMQGQDLSDHNAASLYTMKNYMIFRGPEAYSVFTDPPSKQWDIPTSGKETIEDLCAKLLHSPIRKLCSSHSSPRHIQGFRISS